jgi:uncharacterized protein (TIGR02246 family)
MATLTAAERQFLDLETRYWTAVKDNDTATAVALTDEPCLVTGAQGVAALTRPMFENMMKSATYTLRAFELENVQVRMLGEDTAIVAYKVHEDLTVDGKPVHLDAADASTWVRRDGHWLCALHTESLTGDPFGRDR